MYKRNSGFTLAEVLITLAIIGVVAAITIPILYNNSQNAQFKVAAKEAYSIIAQAFLQVSNDYNGNFLGKFNNATDVLNAVTPYLKVSKTCPLGSTIGINYCFTDKSYYLNGNAYPYNNFLNANSTGLILNNGMTIYVYTPNTSTAACNVDGQSNSCAVIGIDTNGFSPPNKFGYDIYGFNLSATQITPYNFPPYTCIYPPNTGWTDVNNTGSNCSVNILIQ